MESRDERHRDAFNRTLARLRDRSENIRSSLPFNFKAIRDELVNQPIPTGPFILTREQKEMIRGGQPVDDEVAEERVEEPEPMDFQVPEGFVVVENDTFSLDDYLGDQWVKTHIYGHHNQPTFKTPETFAISPHPWQLRGACQMHYMCKSIFRGGICGDEMGLGKTLLAILVMELARNEYGSFSLVVCPASCRMQWKWEILAAYKGGHIPKLLILDDQSISAHTLFAGKYDIVIVSYNFLAASYRIKCAYSEQFERYKRCEGPPPVRTICALFSAAWDLVALPIRRLVLDECHRIKNDDATWYKAAKAIYCNAVVMLSGTILSNRWHDIASPLTLLQGHAFRTKQKFIDTFAPQEERNQQPEPTEKHMAWLQRLLLAVFIARPSCILDLPGITHLEIKFELNEKEEAGVDNALNSYRKARSRLHLNPHNTMAREDCLNSLGHAVRAQLWAAHPSFPLNTHLSTLRWKKALRLRRT
ncbi:P-loop containing nucleoside triphosphate hydrolase protein [Aspergillus minisclerotigenes]|uniref:P-loop containing nucleoside triphosphate hydrolase protein n=1 Tax=Aspergillus minisclerotigenes TaxID=656917 RepID=A0A5N6JA66_9EURO|nr:P-loop containing nucleoside triphosphate hydrolase protein [Aspergillus minisclerotigenes]